MNLNVSICDNCGHVFKINNMTYYCRECFLDSSKTVREEAKKIIDGLGAANKKLSDDLKVARAECFRLNNVERGAMSPEEASWSMIEAKKEIDRLKKENAGLTFMIGNLAGTFSRMAADLASTFSGGEKECK